MVKIRMLTEEGSNWNPAFLLGGWVTQICDPQSSQAFVCTWAPAQQPLGNTERTRDDVKTLSSYLANKRPSIHIQLKKKKKLLAPATLNLSQLKSAHSFVPSARHTLLPLSKLLLIPKDLAQYLLFQELFPQISGLLLLTSLHSLHRVPES